MNTHMLAGAVARAEQARDLLDHAADRRDRGQALRRSPAQRQDEYGARSQQRAAPRPGGRQVQGRDRRRSPSRRPSPTRRPGAAHAGKSPSTDDEGMRADTTLRRLAKIRPAMPGGVIAAGNASQFSRRRRRLRASWSASCAAEARPASRSACFRGFAVAGCEPDEMGIGPVFAVPKLLQRAGPEGRGHRPVGAQRGVRRAGALLPRQARHPDRPAQRQRRRHRDRPSLRHERPAPHRPCADRGQAPRREVRRASPCASAAAWARPACSKCSDASRALPRGGPAHTRRALSRPAGSRLVAARTWRPAWLRGPARAPRRRRPARRRGDRAVPARQPVVGLPLPPHGAGVPGRRACASSRPTCSASAAPTSRPTRRGTRSTSTARC